MSKHKSYTQIERVKKLSFDTNDFDISFARGLSLEDGAATLTDFTASIIGQELTSTIINSNNEIKEVLTCGGGRKNNVLIKKLKKTCIVILI